MSKGVVRRATAGLPRDAWSGSPGVDAVVTALVLAISDVQLAPHGNDRPGSAAMRGVRGSGELHFARVSHP
jgi:hypothetical protein